MVGITISNLVGFSFLPKKMEPNYGFGIQNWNGFGQMKNFGRMIMAPIFSANKNNWLMIKEDLLYDFTDNIWES